MEIRIFDKSLEKFIKNLQKPTIAKLLRTTNLLEKFGQKLGPAPYEENFNSPF